MSLSSGRAHRRCSYAWLRSSRSLPPVSLTLIILLAASNGWGVIRVDTPVTKIYDLAKIVLVGQVVRIDTDQKILEAKVVRVPKGNFAAADVQVQLAGIGDYIRQVELNQPVVIFSGNKSALVHVADNFLSAEALAIAERPELKVTKVNPGQPTFPGRTAGLVRLVDQIANGHPTLLNSIEHVVWGGGVREWGRVMQNADYVLACDLNGDGKAEVLIGNRRSTELLAHLGKSLKDQTARSGLRNARGRWAAFGDIDGDKRIDLLIGNQFWLNRGERFVRGSVLPIRDEADVLAVALLDATGDGRPDAVFLTKNGELRMFENPGAAGREWKELPVKHLWSGGDEAVAATLSLDWGDTGKPCAMVARASGLTRYAIDPDGGPPADFDRLTGASLKAYDEAEGLARWNVMAIVPLDINGDGLEDLVVVLDRKGPTFVNRGFGTFLLNPLPTEALHASYQKEVPWKVTPKTRFGAGDIHGDKFDDLLIVTEDGRLFELDNTPYERLPNRFR